MSDVKHITISVTIHRRSVRRAALAWLAFMAVWIIGAAISEAVQLHSMVFTIGGVTAIIATAAMAWVLDRMPTGTRDE